MRDLKVLVVDDNEINQLLICKILETQGVTTEVAFNGKEAVEKFKDTNFDLVFMDIQMPEMDGYQATGLIRQLENGKNVEIIALTAHAMPEDEAKCLQAGMNQYIIKPVQPQVIIDLVEKVLVKGPGEQSKPQGRQSDQIDRLYQKVYSDLAFLQNIIRNFVENYSEIMPKLELALEQKNFQELRTHAHALKGLVGALEADEAVDIISQIESVARGKSNENMLTLLAKLDTSVSQFINDINIFIRVKTAATLEHSGDENDKSINN